MQGDTLTFLSSAATRGAKAFTAGSSATSTYGARDFDAGFGPFEVRTFAVESLEGLSEVVRRCPSNAFLVRGSTRAAAAIPYRRHLAHGAEPPSLFTESHLWLPIDVDAPSGVQAGDAAAARALLPPAFREARALVQATSSCLIKHGCRVRLWFWLSRAVSDAEAKAWLRDSIADLAIYSPSQPVYICAPTFDGMPDPFEGRSRWGWLPGADMVEVPSLADSAPAHTTASPRSVTIGEAPIPDGQRNIALTAMAGAMRRKGASAEAIYAALAQHNAERCKPPLPDHELTAIARSIENYAPEALPQTLRPSDRAARKELAKQVQRVEADPGLLEDAALRLAPHVAVGALSSEEATTAVARAMAAADVVRPITRDEIQRTIANAPVLEQRAPSRWHHLLRTSDDGAILPGPENLALFLSNALSVRWDARAAKAVWASQPPWGVPAGSEIGECEIELRRYVDRELGWVKCPVSPFDTLISQARTAPFDPFAEAIASFRWDGTERLLSAAPRLLGTPDMPVYRSTFAWWLLSAVARTFEPGCQADHAIVLEGVQGPGKTSFLHALVGGTPRVPSRYFGRHASDTGALWSKDTLAKLCGPVIVEIAENAALSKKDVAAQKAFLDERTDVFRPPYERVAKEHPRRCVFAITVNDAEYLRDLTGARRFWPLPCGRIDLEATHAEAPQLWAEAVHLYRLGTRWHPTTAEARALGLSELQESRRESEAGETSLEEALQRPRKTGNSAVTGETWDSWQLGADGRPRAVRLSQAAGLLNLHPVKDNLLLTRALKALGWVARRRAALRYWQAPDFDARGQIEEPHGLRDEAKSQN